MLKRVNVKILGGTKSTSEEVVLAEGTTPVNLKKSFQDQITKTGQVPERYQVYVRSKKKFAEDETNLYELAEDGDTIEIIPRTSLGSSVRGFIFLIILVWKLVRPENEYLPPKRKYNLEEEMNDMGFKRINEKDFAGWLKTKKGKYYCYLQWKGRGDFELVIREPPYQLLHGSHGACFWNIEHNCFIAHFHKEVNPIAKLRLLQDYINEAGG